MKEAVHFGPNKTGIQMAPRLSREMLRGNGEMEVPVIVDTRVSADSLRETYIRESGGVGAVPMPGSLRGALSVGMRKLAGHHPEVLIDRLGERLAFERSAVRLYEALITKCEAALDEPSIQPLREFRSEEAKHFELVRDVMETLGADPTAQTPCANICAVSSMGIFQVLNDPRTDISQCVEAILNAEMIDNAGWDLLIELAVEAGLDEFLPDFREAKQEEDIHLEFIQSWLHRLVVKSEPMSNQNIDTE
jgi:ferritin-like protein